MVIASSLSRFGIAGYSPVRMAAATITAAISVGAQNGLER
jgi:hypothetical protein